MNVKEILTKRKAERLASAIATAELFANECQAKLRTLADNANCVQLNVTVRGYTFKNDSLVSMEIARHEECNFSLAKEKYNNDELSKLAYEKICQMLLDEGFEETEVPAYEKNGRLIRRFTVNA